MHGFRWARSGRFFGAFAPHEGRDFPWDDPAVIREELFSVERLEDHARSLAAAQTVTTEPIRGEEALVNRLRDNRRLLLRAYRAMVTAVETAETIPPAAEWLIDNFHLVEKQIREIQTSLSPGYYRRLPKLAEGPFADYPRVFGLAWAFVAHTDSRFDSETLLRYARAYQDVQPLTIGELWAISITLRIVLIENLRRLAHQALIDRAGTADANALADRLLGDGAEAEWPPITAELAGHDLAQEGDAFAVQVLHRLRDQDLRVAPALAWIERGLVARGTSSEAVVRDVHRRLGASNVTVRNIITSLRLIADVDWNETVERISPVDDALSAASDFLAMDFPTRNLYRDAIETLARGSGRSELEVAAAAVAATRQGDSGTDAARSADPGYHLLAGGRGAFEVAIGFRPSWRDWPVRLNRRFGLCLYLTAISILALGLLSCGLWSLTPAGPGAATLALLALIGVIPAFDVAVALVNRGVSLVFRATLLPGLDLRDGVPPSLRTVVAVPTLLSDPAAIIEQVERLEILHLASPDGDLYYALVSDWIDAESEQAEGDDAVLALAAKSIARLNLRHPAGLGGPRFLLLHRRRSWSEGEQRWIGWERKRGKLHELNRLLRAAPDTTFISIAGIPPAIPDGVRYVITLDADTRLPRDAARRLVGKMAHPLNRPRFDPALGRVVEGHAVLQPRVTPSLPIGSEGSSFQRIFSSLSGITPYVAAVSDVYQDLFDEGSYVGKGIYDIDAFEAALAGRVPEAALLSHDLFEGVFARAGLASDIEVIEDFPSRYDVSALRHHRWARGDWQLLPWIFGEAPNPSVHDRRSRALSALGRWKMLDNLRCTLSAPMAVLALGTGWKLAGEGVLSWTVFILMTILVPTLIPVVAAIPPRRPDVTAISHLWALATDLRLAVTLSGLNLIFLAHQAVLMGDAILRTLVRLLLLHRHLLEWLPAAQAGNGRRLGKLGFYQRMAGAPLLGLIGVGLAWSTGELVSLAVATPIALSWLLSPLVAYLISRPPALPMRGGMAKADRRMLRLTARRTWRFFETFVTAADHDLPPDNFQEDPVPTLAHRTSPTNIGLYLLSVASAHDFGWIGTVEAADRLDATLATMDTLARYRGHFLNWYDTRDLRPLDPPYVSSVDSGNLAGHLIALANACQEWQSVPVGRLEGITDALDLARAQSALLRDGPRTQTVTWAQLDDALASLGWAIEQAGMGGDVGADRLTRLAAEAEILVDIARALVIERDDGSGEDLLFWVQACLNSIRSHDRDRAADPGLTTRLEQVAATARTLALAMDFSFLFDLDRKLLSIGFLVTEGRTDANCYDLLASEARLASFIAIAKGDVPARHWFRLGRATTPVAHRAALISWSGSMFEYLMPSLVMQTPTDSLLDQTVRLAVRRQIDYATHRRLPWGISESAYNLRDLELTYQYSNFGVPGLGLKRGLGRDRVIAPYATALAAMVVPHEAAANLTRLAVLGGCGRYGFYEALDYTPNRLPDGKTMTVVRAFMAHHQGMTIVALADALFDGSMRRRFHAEPIVRASELLLQERMPRDVSVAHSWAAEVKVGDTTFREADRSGSRRFAYPHQAVPATHLLSNGRLTTMLTAAGSGYTRWGDLAVTRWREDITRDDYGSYLFLRDVRSGAVWSAGWQPSGIEPDESTTAFHEDHAEFTRRDGTLTSTLEVLISAEDDAEVRRLSLSNGGPQEREIDITSYAELVLAPQSADLAHRAFSNLFVETEYLAGIGVLLATRRRRDTSEPEVWAGHLAVVEGDCGGAIEVETDRARFLGRGHSLRAPLAVIDGRALSNSVGTVLDPIFALRRRVQIAPGATVRIAFWTLLADTRDGLLACVDRHRDGAAFARAATLAWTQGQVELHHLVVTPAEAGLFQRLAGHLLYAAPWLRAGTEAILNGGGPQSGVWPLGISGDRPLIVVRVAETDHLGLVREVLLAHEYWRMKRFDVDLVIVNEHPSSYDEGVQSGLDTLIHAVRHGRADEDGAVGRVFAFRADQISQDALALLGAAARVVLIARRGGLFEQLDRRAETRPLDGQRNRARPRPRPAATGAGYTAETAPKAPSGAELEFFNGLGGFGRDGTEYVTILEPGQSTPAPWVNVIANPAFGFLVSAEGGGYSWSLNSRDNQLTPWSNDPVGDPPGEVFFLRDDESGQLWSPTALPIRDRGGVYVARHGWGYSRFEYTTQGIGATLTQSVAPDDPVKLSRLVLRNRSGRRRTISVTAYVEWVLGPSRPTTLAFVTTEIDPVTGAMFARNPWRLSGGGRVAFADWCGSQTDWTGNRAEFIGRNGVLANPAALASGEPLSNRTGAGLDPCGALRTRLVLPIDGVAELVFLLGDAADADAARDLIRRFRTDTPDRLLAETARRWDGVLGRIQVRTPDRAMDILLNGWLLYQTLSCRIWARSAFYQASGAYGFRDQLQDGMALASVCPDETRAHLLRAAARQFPEGDVQHWWLPGSGLGVRGHISDDRVWLAIAVAHYVAVTGDALLLEERVPFLEGSPPLDAAHDSFFVANVSGQDASVFEHCALALDSALTWGAHGLPLIGTGDWNDGMNRVGAEGEGESVWLGWLLYAALLGFAPLAERRGLTERASHWRGQAETLRDAIERDGWDGEWYRRGFFDDGTPLGAQACAQCRIDQIAQSWAVLSGGAEFGRRIMAMAAVERHLIQVQDRLALLFTPPFDHALPDPGYIQAYPPGIRENGGQYTHAALWSVMAFAALGEGDRAVGLFSLLNPINHARTRAGVLRYKVEPYVVAADVYALSAHLGRGGWTWYSGSSGWMQRAGVESILGVRLAAGSLDLDPCLPKDWNQVEMTLRYGTARYHITVDNRGRIGRGIAFAALDSSEIRLRPLRVVLADDGGVHRIEVRIG